MVTQFAEDHSTNISAAEMQEIIKNTRDGDLSLVMKEYEINLKNPIKNLLLGDLMRIILIQVQKSKVDLAIAMKALDKLLKSNQLNFEIIAAIPTVLLTGFALKLLKERIEKGRGRLSSRVELKLQMSLREIEKKLILFINYPEADYQTIGEIYIELHSFTTNIVENVKNKLQVKLLMEDIEDLKSTRLTPKQKHLVLLSMQRTFKFLDWKSK